MSISVYITLVCDITSLDAQTPLQHPRFASGRPRLWGFRGKILLRSLLPEIISTEVSWLSDGRWLLEEESEEVICSRSR